MTCLFKENKLNGVWTDWKSYLARVDSGKTATERTVIEADDTVSEDQIPAELRIESLVMEIVAIGKKVTDNKDHFIRNVTRLISEEWDKP